MLPKLFFSFLFGALFCVIAQILVDKTKLTPARILVSYVVFGVFFGAVGLYEPLFKLAGCGLYLPLVGYGANIAKGIKEAVDELGFWGIFSGALTASAIGLSFSLCIGFLMSVFSRGKPKSQ